MNEMDLPNNTISNDLSNKSIVYEQGYRDGLKAVAKTVGQFIGTGLEAMSGDSILKIIKAGIELELEEIA